MSSISVSWYTTCPERPRKSLQSATTSRRNKRQTARFIHYLFIICLLVCLFVCLFLDTNTPTNETYNRTITRNVRPHNHYVVRTALAWPLESDGRGRARDRTWNGLRGGSKPLSVFASHPSMVMTHPCVATRRARDAHTHAHAPPAPPSVRLRQPRVVSSTRLLLGNSSPNPDVSSSSHARGAHVPGLSTAPATTGRAARSRAGPLDTYD